MAGEQRAQHNWAWRDDLLVGAIYFRIGKVSNSHPLVLAAADVLGVTPNTVGMRLANFQFDDTGVAGLSKPARQVRQVAELIRAGEAAMGPR